ncbi:MAG: esterase family protein [Gemmatimonadota bacterium]|nr:esterase family protein [Gemmatimonadota bacterium]
MIAALLLALSSATAGHAPGRVQLDSFWSPALGTRKQYVVYLPPSYAARSGRRYPVAYYLHGVFGSERDWTRSGHLDAAMDSLLAAGGREMIIVMPDGDDGFYTTWNSLGSYSSCLASTREVTKEPSSTYCVPWPHYDEYIARDLVAHVDSVYRTIADRAHRGIAGLSMGGYGAISLALRYPDVFAAAASHSGVISPLYAGPHPFAVPPRYATDMDSLRAGWGRMWRYVDGVFGRDSAGWLARDPRRLAERLVRAGKPIPAIFIDVGTEDRLADENRAFHWELSRLAVPSSYAEWPGRHDWAYWSSHVGQSLAWLMEHIAGG